MSKNLHPLFNALPAWFILLSAVIWDLITVIFRGYEVKEALRAQMEVQSKLHLQVEVISISCIYILVPSQKVNLTDKCSQWTWVE